MKNSDFFWHLLTVGVLIVLYFVLQLTGISPYAALWCALYGILSSLSPNGGLSYISMTSSLSAHLSRSKVWPRLQASTHFLSFARALLSCFSLFCANDAAWYQNRDHRKRSGWAGLGQTNYWSLLVGMVMYS